MLNNKNFKILFNKYSPLSLNVVVWVVFIFLISAFFNGLTFSLEYSLFILVLFINGSTTIRVVNYFWDKRKVSKSEMRKFVISIVCFTVLNALLLIATNWKLLMAFFLLPLPLIIGIYFMNTRRKRN